MDSKTESILILRCLGFNGEIQTPEGERVEVLKADHLQQERNGLSVSILGPEQMIEWSKGRVSDPVPMEMSRTRSRRGLLSPDIFDRRMNGPQYPVGHIEFPCPIPHPWFFGGVRSLAGILLSMEDEKVLKIALGQIHMVTDAGTSGLQVGEEISAKENDISFESDTGESAISKLLTNIDLGLVKRRATDEMVRSSDRAEKALLFRRLSIIEELFNSGGLPEGLFIRVLPVLPAKLRPVRRLEAGGIDLGTINRTYGNILVTSNKLEERLRDRYAIKNSVPIVAAKSQLYQEVNTLLGLSVFREGLGDDFSYVAKYLGLVQLTPEEIEICLNRENESEDTGATEVLANELQKLGETEITALGKQRVGQNIFRQRLIEHWGGCAITGLRVPELLRASHAKPWRDCVSNEERLDVYNGFLLAPHFDVLFDRGLMTFDDAGLAIFSSQLSQDVLELLGLRGSYKLTKKPDPKQQPYLAWHRKMVFEQNK